MLLLLLLLLPFLSLWAGPDDDAAEASTVGALERRLRRPPTLAAIKPIALHTRRGLAIAGRFCRARVVACSGVCQRRSNGARVNSPLVTCDMRSDVGGSVGGGPTKHKTTKALLTVLHLQQSTLKLGRPSRGNTRGWH